MQRLVWIQGTEEHGCLLNPSALQIFHNSMLSLSTSPRLCLSHGICCSCVLRSSSPFHHLLVCLRGLTIHYMWKCMQVSCVTIYAHMSETSPGQRKAEQRSGRDYLALLSVIMSFFRSFPFLCLFPFELPCCLPVRVQAILVNMSGIEKWKTRGKVRQRHASPVLKNACFPAVILFFHGIRIHFHAFLWNILLLPVKSSPCKSALLMVFWHSRVQKESHSLGRVFKLSLWPWNVSWFLWCLFWFWWC